MLTKLFNLIMNALRAMTSYKTITQEIKVGDPVISDRMSEAFKLWKELYKDEPPWEDENVHSVGIPKTACETLAMLMLSELDIKIVPENYDIEESPEVMEGSMPRFLQDNIDKHLIGKNKLREKLVKALAMGGCVIKPYVSNGQIYYDFVEQGDFYPIAFDDDGNIVDIAFLDQFIEGDYTYTKIERQTFANGQVVVENKAYKAQTKLIDEEAEELGEEVQLKDISRWADIDPTPPTIEDVKGPLYGYFKVARANNVDTKSPLGMSLFQPIVWLCEKIDKQFARLDGEYEGTQLAIDVDPTAMKYTKKHFAYLPQANERIFRYVDLGQDDTYKPYNPNVRDANYRKGLDDYKRDAEDALGLARGTFSLVEGEAKTATEIRILKQRSYDTVNDNQIILEDCLKDVIQATFVYANLYGQEVEAPKNEIFEVIIDGGDSVLVDRESELAAKLQLVDAGILSKAEVRAGYTRESLKTASENVQAIVDTNKANFGGDIFGTEEDEEENEENEEKPKEEEKKKVNDNE